MKDYIGFTLDLRKLASVLGQDPACRAELIAGLQQAAPEPLTSQLGAANIGTNEAPIWYSVFPATVQGKNSGEEGLFYRNNSHEGKGDRIQMRLKMQTATYTQNAPAQEQYQVGPAATPAATLPGTVDERQAAIVAMQTANPEGFAKLLAAIQVAQGDGQLATTAEQPPTVATPSIPENIATVLNSAG